jgi:4-hydroxybenzoate polyprenyltransferase
MQLFVKYGFFMPLNIPGALIDFQFALLVFATTCIAAAGNIINDICDVEIDSINKPEKVIIGKRISEASANRIYIMLSILGVTAGFYLSNAIDKPSYAAIFIVISALLYLYATYVKGILLLGNILVSVLVAISILIVGIFDLAPVIDTANSEQLLLPMKVVLHYAFFAFAINFIREIVKDVQDINGDKNGGLNTLPIAIGRSRTVALIFALGIVTTLSVVLYMYFYLYSTQPIMLYFLFLVVAPLLYFCLRARIAETADDYAFLSVLLKLIMFLGMCSILLYKFVLQS